MKFDRHLFFIEKEIEEIDNLGSEYLDDRPAYKRFAVGTQGFRRPAVPALCVPGLASRSAS